MERGLAYSKPEPYAAATAPAVAPVHRRLLYATALQSGLRANEFSSLTLAHLDWARQGLRLDAAWTKNRQASFHPLPAQLVEDLYAFASAGYPQELYARRVAQGRQDRPGEPLLYVPSRPAQRLVADLRRAGIPQHTVEGKLDFHALRLAYINLVIEAGATVKEAQTLARHAKPQMTLGVYGRTREERLHQVVEQVATVLHDETQRVSSVHRANLAEHTRPVYTSGSNVYSSSRPEVSAVCYTARMAVLLCRAAGAPCPTRVGTSFCCSRYPYTVSSSSHGC
jgi:integrase